MAASIPLLPRWTGYQHPNSPIMQRSTDALLQSMNSIPSLDSSNGRPPSSHSAHTIHIIQTVPSIEKDTKENDQPRGSPKLAPSIGVSHVKFQHLPRPDKSLSARRHEILRNRKRSGPTLEKWLTKDADVENHRKPMPEMSTARRARKAYDNETQNPLQPIPVLYNRPYIGEQSPGVVTETREVHEEPDEESGWQESSTSAERRLADFRWSMQTDNPAEFYYGQDGQLTRISLLNDGTSNNQQPERRRSSVLHRLAGILGLRKRAKSEPAPVVDRKGKGILRTVVQEQTFSRAQTNPVQPNMWEQKAIEKQRKHSSTSKNKIRRISLAWLPKMRTKSL